MEYDIITFGSATQDVFMSSKELKVVEGEEFNTKKGLCVPLGSKIAMDEISFAMGGCGANTSVTFALQEFKSAYCGMVSNDFAGNMVKEELEKHGVSLDLVKETDKESTSFSVIVSLPKVGRSILQKRGASHSLTPDDIDFDKLKAKWFYVSSMSGKSAQLFKPVIDQAVRNGIKLAVTPGKTQLTKEIETLKSILDKVDIFILNLEEAAMLTGLDIEKENEILNKLDKMIKGIVVITKGPDGLIASDGRSRYSAGIPKSDLVDRTGAGDAFGSGFVAGYMEKKDIVYAIQLGTANATGVVQEFGAVNGLLKKGDWGKWEKIEVKKEALP